MPPCCCFDWPAEFVVERLIQPPHCHKLGYENRRTTEQSEPVQRFLNLGCGK
jgi:hypothetical protein